MSRRVLIVVPDLFFGSKLREAARTAGVVLEESTAGALAERCRATAPALVIVDLYAPGDPVGAVRSLKDNPDLRHVTVIGFYRHTDTAMRARAAGAGVDRVMPRSAFVKDLPGLLAGTAARRPG